MKIPRLLLTPGEPAGIGPDITIKALQQDFNAELIVIADPDLLMLRAKKLGISMRIKLFDAYSINPHEKGTITVLPVPLNDAVMPGKLNSLNTTYVIKTLSLAAEYCVAKKADGVVTGPVQKSLINAAGMSFTGHTEFFAEVANVSYTQMLFVIDELKVALLTTHLPLADVPKAITREKLITAITELDRSLKSVFHIEQPTIIVSGLNPHAGEDGHLGKEEQEIIIPTLQALRKQGFHLEGPLSADTLFVKSSLNQNTAILMMYHDQALPVVKYIGMGRSVNVTLGLPFIRTSVDHGTALDVAGTNAADAGSLMAAIKLAIQLTSCTLSG